MDPLESFTISAEVLEQFDWDYNYEEHLLNFWQLVGDNSPTNVHSNLILIVSRERNSY